MKKPTTLRTKTLLPSLSEPRGIGNEHSLSRSYIFLIFIPPLVLAIGMGVFWSFVSFAVKSNVALNGMILGVLAWGVILMIALVAEVYREDKSFASGILYLFSKGSSAGVSERGTIGHVLGMLSRLEKLGLGQPVHVTSSAMEPEFESLNHHFEKRQELPGFLVGLMVALGLLGTFIGLLETLIATGDLISAISKSIAGGGNMEKEFGNVITGLQHPLAAMGTAFSASMFGLVGSILLGFQLIVVRSAVGDFMNRVREEVLAVAKKGEEEAEVEINEVFLAKLMADLMGQHEKSTAQLSLVSHQISDAVTTMQRTSNTNEALITEMRAQAEAVAANTEAMGRVDLMVPLVGELVGLTSTALQDVKRVSEGVYYVVEQLLEQNSIVKRTEDIVHQSVDKLDQSMRDIYSRFDVSSLDLKNMEDTVSAVRRASIRMSQELRVHTDMVKRIDRDMWEAERDRLANTIDKQLDE